LRSPQDGSIVVPREGVRLSFPKIGSAVISVAVDRSAGDVTNTMAGVGAVRFAACRLCLLRGVNYFAGRQKSSSLITYTAAALQVPRTKSTKSRQAARRS
jgi:hypothetical protein